ncbi:hypothetical protein ACSFC1_09745 [Pseudothermotoga sp. U03pept]|uniref:hypothetical protein n=1 Tax=Pseudothermotoga sp. U03pept TaxID=3447012 RepID=UPI003F0DC651
MKKVVLLVSLLVCVYLFAYVPATSDYVLLLRDLETVNSFLPPISRFQSTTKGFVCFFGKLSLNLSSLVGLFETEEFGEVQDLLSVSIVTDDPNWVKTNLSELVESHELIQSGDLYYFVTPSMLEDVRAMIDGEIPAFELPETQSIYVKIRTIPIFGIIFHLLGFNEGVPVEDEISVNLESETAVILIKAVKEGKFDWEIKKIRYSSVPDGLKVLRDAQFSLIMPTTLLKQLPTEILEELEIDFEELDFIFSKATSIALSFSEEMSKFAVFFDLKNEFLDDLLEKFKEWGVSVKTTEDFVYVELDELTAVLPTKGGIAQILSSNVAEKDLVKIEGGMIGKISFKEADMFVDLSLSREGCSVIVNATVSKNVISELLKQILSEFLPKLPEMKLIIDIIQHIDEMTDYMYLDPPETIEELADIIPAEFVDRLSYERKEEDGKWVVSIGVKSDLVDYLTENDVMEVLSYYSYVDSVRFDLDNKIIYVTKTYKKAEPFPLYNLVEDLVTGISWYYEDFGSMPENLKDLVYWYFDSPEWLFDSVTYDHTTDGETITVRLEITTDQETDLEELIQDLDLKEAFYENGKLIVIFEIP